MDFALKMQIFANGLIKVKKAPYFDAENKKRTKLLRFSFALNKFSPKKIFNNNFIRKLIIQLLIKIEVNPSNNFFTKVKQIIAKNNT